VLLIIEISFECNVRSTEHYVFAGSMGYYFNKKLIRGWTLNVLINNTVIIYKQGRDNKVFSCKGVEN